MTLHLHSPVRLNWLTCVVLSGLCHSQQIFAPFGVAPFPASNRTVRALSSADSAISASPAFPQSTLLQTSFSRALGGRHVNRGVLPRDCGTQGPRRARDSDKQWDPCASKECHRRQHHCTGQDGPSVRPGREAGPCCSPDADRHYAGQHLGSSEARAGPRQRDQRSCQARCSSNNNTGQYQPVFETDDSHAGAHWSFLEPIGSGHSHCQSAWKQLFWSIRSHAGHVRFRNFNPLDAYQAGRIATFHRVVCPHFFFRFHSFHLNPSSRFLFLHAHHGTAWSSVLATARRPAVPDNPKASNEEQA
eukprot:m.490289 g.490289  ORF g.490289 m.490289 type:complete len:303 (+) comp57249_c1_seq1:84-992(+)